MAILAALFARIFGRLLGPCKGAVAVVLGISVYTILVGANAAVVRAAIMGGLSIFARRSKLPVRQAAWYAKPLPTFSDALAIVRQHLWQHLYFLPSHFQGDVRKIPAKTLECLRNAVCYTA